MALILVVDDEPTLQELLEDTLVLGGHEVRIAGCGGEALTAAASEPPDLVILDVMMPGMSGFQVLETLRAAPTTHGLPVIMLTARADDTSTWQGWRAGADIYLPKPFDPADLLRWVERLTAPSQAPDERFMPSPGEVVVAPSYVPAVSAGDGFDVHLRHTVFAELRLLAS